MAPFLGTSLRSAADGRGAGGAENLLQLSLWNLPHSQRRRPGLGVPLSKGRDGLAPALDQRRQRPQHIAWKGGREPCEHHTGAPCGRYSEEGGPEAEDRRTAGQLWPQRQAAGFTHTPPSPPKAAPRGGHEAGFCRRQSFPRTTPQKGRKQDSSFAWRLQPRQPVAALEAQCLPRSFPTSPYHRGLPRATYLASGGRGLNRPV